MDLLERYLGGTLPPGDRAALEDRLAADPALRRDLADYRLLRQTITDADAQDFAGRVRRVMTTEATSRVSRRQIAAGVIAFVLLVLVFLFFKSPRAAPPPQPGIAADSPPPSGRRALIPFDPARAIPTETFRRAVLTTEGALLPLRDSLITSPADLSRGVALPVLPLPPSGEALRAVAYPTYRGRVDTTAGVSDRHLESYPGKQGHPAPPRLRLDLGPGNYLLVIRNEAGIRRSVFHLRVEG